MMQQRNKTKNVVNTELRKNSGVNKVRETNCCTSILIFSLANMYVPICEICK